MTLKPLILSLAVLGIGCSSSNDDNDDPNDSPDQAQSDGTVQFSEPDVNGTSDLARLGYPVVRDLSRELVTGAYLDTYFDIDRSVWLVFNNVLGATDAIVPGNSGESDGPADCPQGGSVDVSFIWYTDNTLRHTATFVDCVIDDHTLSGQLERQWKSGVTGGGGYSSLNVWFTDLTIQSENSGRLLVNGSAKRTSDYSSSGMLPPEELGSCTLENNLHLTESTAITSAQLERPGINGSVTVSQSEHERDDDRRYDATSDDLTCPLFRRANETGAAIITFDGYGVSDVNGQATVVTALSTFINDNENISDHAGTQSSELPDDSSVRMTVLSDTEGSVQVDINADGAAISFIDSYQFVSPDFEL